MIFTTKAFADTTTTQATTAVPTAAGAPVTGPAPNPIMTFLPFIAMFAVFYFLMIRPQQKKIKDHEVLVNNLQKGEEVITSAGIIGKIHGIADKFITLEIDNNVRIKILKSRIETIVRPEQKA
ncbi:MAG: preprotein translocase subunit YajC [Bdellovibrionota bacterium]